MSLLRYPFAKRGSEWITPNQASKDDVLRCYCGARMKLRKGIVRRAHFAHVLQSECPFGAAGESDEHLAAKQILAENVSMIRFPVSLDCGHHVVWRQLPIETRVKIEASVEGCRLRFDVLAYVDDTPLAALEVFHTHRSTQSKIQYCIDNGIIFMDFVALDLLRQKFDANLIELPYHMRNCKPCDQCAYWMWYTQVLKPQLEYVKMLEDAWEKVEHRNHLSLIRRRKRQALIERTYETTVNRFKTTGKIVGKCGYCGVWVDLPHAGQVDLLVLSRETRKICQQNSGRFWEVTENRGWLYVCINCITDCDGCGATCVADDLLRYGLCVDCNTSQ